jgi:hypothetical protein
MHHHMSPMSPVAILGPNVADIPEEMREKALKRTAEMLRKIDEVRRSLELPVDHLPIVIETYGKIVHALIAETDREELAKHTKRLPITMKSENRDYTPMKIKRGDTVEVIVRPQVLTFRLEDVAIHGDRAHWLVHDIKIGNRSQFAAKRGPAPGNEFGPGGVLEHMRLDTAQTAMDINFVVEYVGPDPDGAVFEATLVGTAVEF